MKKQHTRRVRVTFSLSAELLEWIDKSRKKGEARSRVVEALLLQGEKIRKQRELDEEIRAYYSVPPTREEKAFTKALGRAARKLVIDDVPQKRRGG